MSDSMPSDDEGDHERTLGDGEPEDDARLLKSGDHVGRYQITAQLGRGGMGIVYAAHDPELDRRLAIKVLHPHARGSLGSSSGQQRMLREARAMARLSHRNVVVVHDVGTVDRSVFVAMEFIEGRTLAAWTEGTRRPWREVLRVFLAAGEGLAAAHHVGLVHRDFKPDNVMITDGDQRVVVMDFGLARTTIDVEDQSTGQVASHDGDPRLTQTGAMLGTPAYMAPEQHLGLPTSAQSDQFSFCVALHEALFGVRPFKGDTLAALALAVSSGKRSDPDDHRGVPSRVHRAIVRGLEVEPGDRWPDMRTLLDELARDPARTRRRVLAIAAVPVLAVAGAFALDRFGNEGATPTCSDGADELAPVWNDARRETIAQAMHATGLGHADETRSRVEAAVDRFAKNWSAQFRDACEATNVRAVQSPDLLDRRMSCLHRRKGELDAMLGELEQPSRTMIDRAISGIERTTELESCADVERLLAAAAEPDDAEERSRVASLQAQLATAMAQRVAGRMKESSATIEAALAELDRKDWPPLRAELMFARAQTQQILGDPIAAERTLTDGYWIARKSGNDRIAAQLSSELMGQIAESRPQDAKLWEQQARADVERLGDEGELKARLLDTLGMIATAQYELDRAEQYHTEALAIWKRIGGEDGIDVAVAEHDLGNVEFMRNDDEGAAAHYRRAIEIWRARLGDGHPQLADPLHMLGNVAHRAGKLDEAEREFAAAVELLERAYGDTHEDLAGPLNGLALVYGDRGEHERALAIHERVLAIGLAAQGDTHPTIAITQHNAGVQLGALGRHEDALARHRIGLSIREKTLGLEHPQVSESLEHVAEELLALRRYAEAIPPLERALPIVIGVEGPPEFVTQLRLMLARAQFGAGQGLAKTRATLAQTREDFAKIPADDPSRAAVLQLIEAFERELPAKR